MSDDIIKPMRFSKLFSVGHKAMDAHHEKLFSMINSLIELQDQSLSTQQKAIAAAVPKLAAYASKHFAAEEHVMRLAKHSDYDEHILKHKALVAQVVALKQNLDAGKIPPLREILVFLKFWLMQHILVIDKRYTENVMKHNVNQEEGMNDVPLM